MLMGVTSSVEAKARAGAATQAVAAKRPKIQERICMTQ